MPTWITGHEETEARPLTREEAEALGILYDPETEAAMALEWAREEGHEPPGPAKGPQKPRRPYSKPPGPAKDPQKPRPAAVVPDGPRLAVSKPEAAALLGRSVDWIEDHLMGEIKTIRRGQSVLIPVRELEDWIERSSSRALR